MGYNHLEGFLFLKIKDKIFTVFSFSFMYIALLVNFLSYNLCTTSNVLFTDT